MTATSQTNLLEQIQVATRPLTDNEQFQFGTIHYDVYNGVFKILLHSGEMTVIFLIRLKFATKYQAYDTRNYVIYIPSIKKSFNAEYLLPALNIPIFLKRESSIWGIHKEHTPETSMVRYQVEVLCEDYTVFSDIFEFCSIINQNLSVICSLILPNRIEQVIRLYEAEIEKSKSPGDRYNLSEFNRYNRIYGS